MLPRLQLPPSHAVLVVLALAFVAPGLVGHDPWRAFDVIAIEVVHQMHTGGDWVVPRIAGKPWLDDPPLYHWAALAFGKILGGLLGFHNAVRLASGAAVMCALWLLYLAARHSTPGKDAGRAAGACATLLLVGSVGLIVHAHEAVPDLLTLAATSAALLFLVASARKPARYGALFGLALGVAFLGTGPLAPAVLGATALLAHALCDGWRARAARFFAPAAAVFLLLAVSWPIALALRSPELADAWLSALGRPRDSFGANLRYYLATASWFAWPAWLLAAWALWALRREWRAPRLFVPLAAALLALPAIAWLGPRQDINAMLLLPPLALLGAHGVAHLQRGAANALDWFGVMTFGFFAFLLWLGYVAMMTGVPPRVANNFIKTAPGFVAHFEPVAFAAGLALTLAWVAVLLLTPRAPTRGLMRWAAGVALLWGGFATLWLPWADYQKSYRGVALQLRSVIPAGAGCVAHRDLGDPQRAALSYHAGIVTQPLAVPPKCDMLLVQGHPRQEAPPGPGWRKLADVGRPGDKRERFRLYRLTKG